MVMRDCGLKGEPMKRLVRRGLLTVRPCACGALVGAHSRLALLPASGHVVTNRTEQPQAERSSAMHTLAQLQQAATGHPAVCGTLAGMLPGVQRKRLESNFRTLKKCGLVRVGRCVCDCWPRAHSRVTFLPERSDAATSSRAVGTMTAGRWGDAVDRQKADSLARRIVALLSQHADRELSSQELSEHVPGGPAKNRRYVVQIANKLRRDGLIEASREGVCLYWTISASGLAQAGAKSQVPATVALEPPCS